MGNRIHIKPSIWDDSFVYAKNKNFSQNPTEKKFGKYVPTQGIVALTGSRERI